MPGGGFMQHASDTNRKDKAQKAARREKFNRKESKNDAFGQYRAIKLDFPQLTQEQMSELEFRMHLPNAGRKAGQSLSYYYRL